MSDFSWEKVETIVDKALDLPEGKRLAFVKEECRGNEKLKREVTLFLESIADSEGWLDDPKNYKKDFYEEISRDVDLLSTDRSLIGKQVGSYVIKEQIGEGGMGTVYMAERSGGEFEHRVAIKIMRHGRVTDENIQRFRREQGILAGLNHSGIARLLDGGITEDGFPYIIMEYVDGTPITDYCRDNRCDIGEKIRLSVQALEAVRHAHENLVIHRDLKPGNILVDEEGDIKILDFGISKLLDNEEELTLTKTGSRLLTPRYAAPEQVRQENITTATDLYAFGIVFYQLLIGEHPYDFDDLTQYEMEQAILNQEADKPSTKVPNQKYRKQLQGDLDAIALKALRKEKDRRYRVANEFLEDLVNYRKGLPVSAREDSLRYRSQKFLRRHAKAVAIAAGILLLMVTFAGFYTWQITEERNRAQLEAEKAEQITGFLTGLFKTNDPTFSKGDTLTARNILELGEEKINELDNQPEIKAEILQTLGKIYAQLSYPDKSDSLRRASLSIKKKLHEAPHPELASIYYDVGSNEHLLGNYENSVSMLDTALTHQIQIYGQQSAQVGKSLKLLAESLREGGKIDSAYQTVIRSKFIYEALDDTLSEEYLKVLMEYGSILIEKGDYAESIKIWDRSSMLSQKIFTPPSPQILNNLNGLANAYKQLGQYDAADSLYRISITMTKELYGRRHINTGVTLNNMAGLNYYRNEYKRSDSLYKEAYSILKEILGEEHPYSIVVLYNQANLLRDMGDYRAAEMLYKKVLELDREQLGENHPSVSDDLAALANLYKQEENYELAKEFYTKALNLKRQIYEDSSHINVALTERSLAEINAETGNLSKAEELYKSALKVIVETYGENHEEVTTTAENYARLLKEQNKPVSPASLINTAKQVGTDK